MKVYNGALQSKQRATAIRSKLIGEEHESTADSYENSGARLGARTPGNENEANKPQADHPLLVGSVVD